jgi:hypothetical protein
LAQTNINPRYLVACGCGRQIPAAESQAGITLPCVECGRQVTVPPLSRLGRLPREANDDPVSVSGRWTRSTVISREASVLFVAYSAVWAACGAMLYQAASGAVFAVYCGPTSLIAALVIVMATPRCREVCSMIVAAVVWFYAMLLTFLLLFTYRLFVPYDGKDVDASDIDDDMGFGFVILFPVLFIMLAFASLVIGAISGAVLELLRRKVP